MSEVLSVFARTSCFYHGSPPPSQETALSTLETNSWHSPPSRRKSYSCSCDGIKTRQNTRTRYSRAARPGTHFQKAYKQIKT